MKRTHFYLMILAAFAVILAISIISCEKDEDVPDTTITLDITETDPMNIGETLTVQVTIVAGKVVSLKYYKIVDNVKGTAVDVTANVVSDGNDHTYTFTYVLQDGDDLHTLGFEFEVTDGKNVVNTAAVLVNTVLSVKSSFIKYDWRITAQTWLGLPALQIWDSLKVFRFNPDSTYEVDLSADYASYTHHFCYWVYKETPDNGDTLAVLRMIRRLLTGGVASDESYDFRITAANESEMTMYWDIPAFFMFDIERTFKSQPKGQFQPYGTEAYEDSADIYFTGQDCGSVDDDLLTID